MLRLKTMISYTIYPCHSNAGADEGLGLDKDLTLLYRLLDFWAALIISLVSACLRFVIENIRITACPSPSECPVVSCSGAVCSIANHE